MAFTVVMDVPPIEAAAASRALATCNAALGVEQCALTGGDATAQWYALVRIDPERAEVLTIQLFLGSADGARVANSELEFTERDAPAERWASAGVVVAALVAAQSSTPKRAPPPPVPVVVPPPPAPRPPRAPPPRPRWLRVDLGLTVGSEDREGATRLGPLGRVGIAFAKVPVFAFASGAYMVRSAGSPEFSWVSGSLGFGTHLAFARDRAALELRGEAVIESLTVRATQAGTEQSAQRTRVGGRIGADLCGYFSKDLSFVAGVEAGALAPRVVVDIGGQDRARLPTFAWGFISVLRYEFR